MKKFDIILLTQDHGHEVGGNSRNYDIGLGGKDSDHENNSHKGKDNDHGNDLVTIFINESAYQAHQGRLEVSKIRELDDIPITDVLYQMPDYLLLDNNGFVIVHGGEKFKSGGSSGHSS